MAGPAQGLSSILDTAVRSSLTHLASVDPPPHSEGVDKGPSRVDFLYYEGQAPYYDYYYDQDYPAPVVAPADALLSPPSVSPPPWASHLTPRPPLWVSHAEKFDVRPPLYPPPNNEIRRQDRVDSVLTSLAAYLPAILILPIIAATSYYLVVLNGPTPVVKERWGEEVWQGELSGLAGLVRDIVTQVWGEKQDQDTVMGG